jgi:hypothetical protein
VSHSPASDNSSPRQRRWPLPPPWKTSGSRPAWQSNLITVIIDFLILVLILNIAGLF